MASFVFLSERGGRLFVFASVVCSSVVGGGVVRWLLLSVVAVVALSLNKLLIASVVVGVRMVSFITESSIERFLLASVVGGVVVRWLLLSAVAVVALSSIELLIASVVVGVRISSFVFLSERGGRLFASVVCSFVVGGGVGRWLLLSAVAVVARSIVELLIASVVACFVRRGGCSMVSVDALVRFLFLFLSVVGVDGVMM